MQIHTRIKKSPVILFNLFFLEAMKKETKLRQNDTSEQNIKNMKKLKQHKQKVQKEHNIINKCF